MSKVVIVNTTVCVLDANKKYKQSYRTVWDEGTLEQALNRLSSTAEADFRRDYNISPDRECLVIKGDCQVLDNELPNQYEQPPAPQQPAEPTLESLVASIERLAEISTKGNIDLSPAIKAIQDEIVALATAGTMR